jgi:hypothetical protein
MEEINRESFKHSSFYHSFFRGWTEKKVPGPGGKGDRILRVYSEDYICPQNSRGREILGRAAYAVLTAAGCIFLGLASCSHLALNFAVCVEIPVFCSILSALLTAVTVLLYLFRSRKMTLYEFESTSEKLGKRTLIAAFCTGAAAAASILYSAVYPGSFSGGAGMAILEYLLSAGMFGTICFLEKKKPYVTSENANEIPQDGNEIW